MQKKLYLRFTLFLLSFPYKVLLEGVYTFKTEQPQAFKNNPVDYF